MPKHISKMEDGHFLVETDEEYKKIDAILEATEVTVLARENGMSCVIFINQKDHRHAAWVNSTRLVYEYK